MATATTDSTGFETVFAGLNLDHPVGLGPGWVKNLDSPEFDQACRSAASFVTIGSITVPFRKGNSGEVYDYNTEAGCSINSLGMPNRGFDYYFDHLPMMVDRLHQAGKKVIVSIAGESPEEYDKLLGLACLAKADAAEFNLGCPNVLQDGQRVRVVCYDPGLTREILSVIIGNRLDIKIGVKLSPILDSHYLEILMSIISEYKREIDYVAGINTVPNTRNSKDGVYGGLGGKTILPIALGQISQWRSCLPAEIDILGFGGANSWEDVRNFKENGATACGITTAAIETNCRIFYDIIKEAAAVTD